MCFHFFGSVENLFCSNQLRRAAVGAPAACRRCRLQRGGRLRHDGGSRWSGWLPRGSCPAMQGTTNRQAVGAMDGFAVQTKAKPLQKPMAIGCAAAEAPLLPALLHMISTEPPSAKI